jgi:hypothetical protein
LPGLPSVCTLLNSLFSNWKAQKQLTGGAGWSFLVHHVAELGSGRRVSPPGEPVQCAAEPGDRLFVAIGDDPQAGGRGQPELSPIRVLPEQLQALGREVRTGCRGCDRPGVADPNLGGDLLVQLPGVRAGGDLGADDGSELGRALSTISMARAFSDSTRFLPRRL